MNIRLGVGQCNCGNSRVTEIVVTETDQLISQAERISAKNYAPLPVVISKARGVWAWDTEGRRYLDCLSAYSSMSLGHCHPRIVDALTEQAQRLTLTSRAFHNDRMGPFLELLCELCQLDMALPMNTGAEAVETAIKLVRKWGYRVKGVPHDRAEIIVCRNNFHGRTTTIVGFSSEAAYREDFGPYGPGFELIDFGDPDQLDAAITPNTVAFLVEPIQAEAGIRIPPPGYLSAIRRICSKHGILLVLDEIQTGLGRTGKFLAHEHVGRGTGETALEIIRDEHLSERAAELGDYLLDRLRQIRSPLVAEIRGRGLLVGIELQPGAPSAREICSRLLERGVLTKDTHERVVRLAPPLIIEKDELDWVSDQLEEALTV